MLLMLRGSFFFFLFSIFLKTMPATRSSSPGRRKRASASQKITPFNVYWFYPNLIGWQRFFCCSNAKRFS